uniref:Uncharacterized LOC100187136 n=1 Tax=Ciona intestinalis TaxID=7719 RepID=F6W2H1_CIOIN
MKRSRKREKTSNKRRKTINLPEICIEDDYGGELDQLSTSLIQFPPSVVDDDSDTSDELPQVLSKVKSEKIMKGDLVWVKHNVKNCYWPSYVKSVEGTKISIYFISYNKFTKGERSWKYNIKSKKIKRFDDGDYKLMVEAGRRHYNKINDENGLALFNNAVDLAETYSLERCKDLLKDEKDILKYFNSNGFSVCYEQCLEEHRGGGGEGVVTPGVSMTPSDPSTPDNCMTPCDPAAPVDPTTPTDPTIPKDPATPDNLVTPNDPVTPCDPLTPGNPTKRKIPDNPSLKYFNRRNEKIVCYITEGKCDKTMVKVFNQEQKSPRMKSYLRKWGKLPGESRGKDLDYVYFEDEKQLKVVCDYLGKFVADNCGKLSLIESDDLIFRVLLPEATIESISKVQRRKPSDAEKIYTRGYKGRMVTFDPCLTSPLTEDDETKMKRRIKNFAF